MLIVMGKLEIGKVLEVEAGAGIWDKSGMRSLMWSLVRKSPGTRRDG